MALKPEVSLPTGLAVAGVVYGIYQVALPPVADVRASQPDHPDVSAAERTATWTAAAVVSGISLLAKDPTIFVIGSGAVIFFAWFYRHGNMVLPELAKAIPDFTGEADQVPPDQMSASEDYNYASGY